MRYNGKTNIEYIFNPHYRLKNGISVLSAENYVGKEFTIGNVKLKGIRLCEPCPYLAETVNPLVIPNMVGVAGLRAQIITSGTIKKGEIVNG